ncbi:hypothetical protein OEZ60_13565 [Defluviimonas sp. WL0024]|uniref:DUF4178 domain-containing protein n=2 Tax=Albidovulum TaxID=205889 RepID=A0ABT3J593_9RHOB|nr:MULTISPECIES: DUF6544 family protein [Defluviimonas]MCU9849030.1 hypothetical protein [Defluviimonas sp. WL0024]MCW3782843.1 hypothetical protein [Defluviimonas salinarum]
MQTAFYLVLLAVIGLLALQVAAAKRCRGRVLQLAARLRDTPPTRDIDIALPPLVADFARRAGADPGRPMRAASFNQTAELRLKPGGRFHRIEAWQVVSLGRAGFVWDARQPLGPLTRLRVLDAFVGGEGLLEARLLGTIPVARASGAEIDLGEAYRYLAELPWMPDAILGNPDLTWRVTGPDTAEVRMTTRDGIARVTFGFDAQGDIVAMEARDRPARDPDGTTRRYDWRGRFSDYREIGGRRLPGFGEVGYVYPSGYEAYFRGRISDYRLAP